MTPFKVSVIIPVYNAEKYLRKCIETVVDLEEVGEIILIEDKSPDNALALCKELAHENSKIKLLQHPNGENRGAGASRNLGLTEAVCDYIAFLDADDIYLANRFEKAKEIFSQQKNIDGVYEAVGIFKESVDSYKLFTVKEHIEPEKLFHYLIRGTYGHFHTNGITFKKSLLQKTGLFNSDLRLHQDTDLWLKFAFKGNLVHGNITTPVALVRTHDQNRIKHANSASNALLYENAIRYYKKQKINLLDYLILLKKYARFKSNANKSSFAKELISGLFK